ncbi:hypothetical protein YTPLAS18_10400 [Nitrospira sp.]|nr:hypothetical protein YTPLAS18_10400 [Nitrospira sp.]
MRVGENGSVRIRAGCQKIEPFVTDWPHGAETSTKGDSLAVIAQIAVAGYVCGVPGVLTPT